MIDFTVPLDCLAGVGDVFSGQYEIPPNIGAEGLPRVLDIGANCGAFTIWACLTWPGCHVTAYEPQPDIFDYLARNLSRLANTSAVNKAVGNPSLRTFRRGVNSRLHTSQYDLFAGDPLMFEAAIMPPEELPEADIIKIDAEGAEGYICEHLKTLPKILICEWHGHGNYARVMCALTGRMFLASHKLLSTETGIQCWATVSTNP